MKTQSLLNADARAVLLAAQLPNEQNQRGHIRENEDVRGSQLKKGSERLVQLGYVQRDTYLLTDAGVHVARKLQENEARLNAGIPFAERTAAIKARGGRETSDVLDEWQTCELRGEKLSTNGHFIIKGLPPSTNPLSREVTETDIIRTWFEMLAGDPQPVRPVAYTEFQHYKRRERLIWFDDGSALHAEIYNFITERFRIQRWLHSQERVAAPRGKMVQPYAFNAFSKGVRVAVAMPYYKETSETVLRLIEEAKLSAAEPKSSETDETVSRPFESASAVQMSLLGKAA